MGHRRGDGRGKYAPTGVRTPPGIPVGDYPLVTINRTIRQEEEQVMAQSTGTSRPTPSDIRPRPMQTADAAPAANDTAGAIAILLEELAAACVRIDKLTDRVAELEARPVRGNGQARKYNPDALSSGILAVLERIAPFDIKLSAAAIADALDDSLFVGLQAGKSSNVSARLQTLVKHKLVKRSYTPGASSGNNGLLYYVDPPKVPKTDA